MTARARKAESEDPAIPDSNVNCVSAAGMMLNYEFAALYFQVGCSHVCIQHATAPRVQKGGPLLIAPSCFSFLCRFLVLFAKTKRRVESDHMATVLHAQVSVPWSALGPKHFPQKGAVTWDPAVQLGDLRRQEEHCRLGALQGNQCLC